MFPMLVKKIQNEAVSNRLICCFKRYFILSVSLQDWKSSVVILSIFVRNYDESLHLMGILKGNGAHPPLYFYMYHMFFFPRKLFISVGIIIIDSAIPSNLYFFTHRIFVALMKNGFTRSKYWHLEH